MIRIGIRLDDNGIRVNAVSEGDDGETVVKVHRNKRRKMALSASIHHPISDHMSWEDGLRCLGIQGDAVAHSIPIADVVLDRRGGQGTAVPSCQYRHDDAHASGEDVRRIREGMCVGGDIPDSIHVMMVNVNGHMYRSRMTKEVESMFEFLGMDAGNLENMMDLINGGPARLYHVLSQICHSHMNGGPIVPAYGFIRTRSGTVAPQVRFQFKTQSNERLPDRGSYNARILPT